MALALSPLAAPADTQSASPVTVAQTEVAVILAKMQNNISTNGFYIPSPKVPKARRQIESSSICDALDTARMSSYNAGFFSRPNSYCGDNHASGPYLPRSYLNQMIPGSADWSHEQVMRLTQQQPATVTTVHQPAFVSSGTTKKVGAPSQAYQQVIRSLGHSITHHPANQTHEDLAPAHSSISSQGCQSSGESDNPLGEIRSAAVSISEPVNQTIGLLPIIRHSMDMSTGGLAPSSTTAYEPPTPVTAPSRKRKRSVPTCHPCDTCQKKFTSRRALLEHSGVHKPGCYMCVYCGKKFNQRSTLQVHTRLHTGEKPYTCTFCKKQFSDNSSHVKHLRVHTKEHPYKCHLCDRGFSQSGNKKRHMATVHRDVGNVTVMQKNSKLEATPIMDVEF